MEKVMNKNPLTNSLIIPFQELSSHALQGVVEEFVTRDGTDSGQSEVPLDTKVHQVLNQLRSGKAVIFFDQKAETCNTVPVGAFSHYLLMPFSLLPARIGAAGGISGAMISSRIANRTPEIKLAIIIGLFLAVLSLRLLTNTLFLM